MHAALAARYADEQFVSVMPLSDPAVLAEGSFDVQACNDTQRADLFVFAGAEQVLLMARIDNLGKGASGAAVQTMNLHLGLPEGLSLPGLIARRRSRPPRRLHARRVAARRLDGAAVA